MAKFYPTDDVMLNGAADVASAGQWARCSCVISDGEYSSKSNRSAYFLPAWNSRWYAGGFFNHVFQALWENKMCLCCVLYWRFAGKQSWAAHLCVHTATIMKNGTFAHVESVRMAVFHAPCARKMRLMLRLIQTSKRKDLHWQDFCIRGDLLPADVMLTSK